MILKLFLLTCLCFSGNNAVYARDYKVQKGDTLSDIGFMFFVGRVYGKHGSLARIASLNPGIIPPDLILPGYIIELGELGLFPQPSKDMGKRDLASVPPPPPAVTNIVPVEVGYSSFGIFPSTFFLQLRSTEENSTAIALTKSAYGLNVDWTGYWSSSFSTQFWSEYQKIDYQVSSGRSFANSKYSKLNFGVAGIYNISTRLKLALGLAIGDKHILRSVSDTELIIDEMSHKTVHIDPSVTFYKGVALEAELGGTYKYVLSSKGVDLEADTDTSIGMNILVRHKLGFGDIEGKAFYLKCSGKYANGTISEEEIKFWLGVRLFLGKK